MCGKALSVHCQFYVMECCFGIENPLTRVADNTAVGSGLYLT